MERPITIEFKPANVFLQWEWSVPRSSGAWSTNPYRDGVFSSGYYGFGSSFTRAGAIRAAKRWIRQLEADEKKFGAKARKERVLVDTEK